MKALTRHLNTQPHLQRRTSVACSLTLALLLAGSASAQAQTADAAKVESFISQATTVAGDDMKAPLQLCKTATEPQPTEEQEHAALAKLMTNSYVPPAKVFDNLYFLGTSWVSGVGSDHAQGHHPVRCPGQRPGGQGLDRRRPEETRPEPERYQVHRRDACPRRSLWRCELSGRALSPQGHHERRRLGRTGKAKAAVR